MYSTDALVRDTNILTGLPSLLLLGSNTGLMSPFFCTVKPVHTLVNQKLPEGDPRLGVRGHSMQETRKR